MGSRDRPTGHGDKHLDAMPIRLVRAFYFVRESPKKAAEVAIAVAWRRIKRRVEWLRWTCYLLIAGRPIVPVDGWRVRISAGNGSGRDERGRDANVCGNSASGVVGNAAGEGPKFGRWDRGSATGVSMIATVVILSWLVGCTLAEGIAAKPRERPNQRPELWAQPKPHPHDNEQSRRVAVNHGGRYVSEIGY
jgi:hypothetical protein